MNDPQEIIDFFKQFISKNGGSYMEWYIGVSNSVAARLYLKHRVNADKDPHIIHPMPSSGIGMQVKQHFLGSGCDGEPDGHNLATRHVYAYKKNERTVP